MTDRRVTKQEWHWLCRVLGHRWTRTRFSRRPVDRIPTTHCTRCGFHPAGQPQEEQ